jgi:signal transduction histidine kinase
MDLGNPTRARRSHLTFTDEIKRLTCELQDIIQQLDEGVVCEFDLTAELQTLKSFYEDIGRVRITLDLQPSALALLTREEEREMLFIVRQALSNYVRPTRATRATISIRRRGGRIRLCISDEGTGSAPGQGHSLDCWLVGIEARAKNLGGVFRVQCPKGRGTQITLEFSLEPMLVVV